MRMPFAIVAAVAAVLWAGPSEAAEKTLNLFIPQMNCASCPFIVKSAISKLDGIHAVTASLETRTATVVFDDTRTSVKSVLGATAEIGYTATVIPPKS